MGSEHKTQDFWDTTKEGLARQCLEWENRMESEGWEVVLGWDESRVMRDEEKYTTVIRAIR